MTASPAQPLCVALGFDEWYILPAGVVVKSMLQRTAAQSIQLFVLADGVSPAGRERFLAYVRDPRVQVNWVTVPPELYAGLPHWGRWKRVIYNRVMVGDLLPREIKRVVWVDTDMLFEGDVAEIWGTDLGGCVIGVVQDMAIPNMAHPMGLLGYDELGLSDRDPYFNDGLMLVDLERWRSLGVFPALGRYLQRKAGAVRHFEQDGLNAVLAGRWKPLPLAWNVIASVAGRTFFSGRGLEREAYAEAVRRPRLLHFAGRYKPWLGRTGSRYQSLYDVALAELGESVPNPRWYPYDRFARRWLFGLEQLSWRWRQRPPKTTTA